MLELKNICFEADGKKILDDVSLTIDNRFTAITGPNGSGKSTLAKIIAGIVTPTSGKIILDGVDITDMDITERSKEGVTFAFQQPVKFKGLSVKDLITIAAGENITVSQACGYLSQVGLCAKDYIDREINGSLSGGELKRIEIAIAMARNTKFTIFDEPEAGIDLWSFNNLINVFRKLSASTDGSVLIISHQERILSIADRIIVIAGGKVVSQESDKDEALKKMLNFGGTACKTLMDKLV